VCRLPAGATAASSRIKVRERIVGSLACLHSDQLARLVEACACVRGTTNAQLATRHGTIAPLARSAHTLVDAQEDESMVARVDLEEVVEAGDDLGHVLGDREALVRVARASLGLAAYGVGHSLRLFVRWLGSRGSSATHFVEIRGMDGKKGSRARVVGGLSDEVRQRRSDGANGANQPASHCACETPRDPA